MRFGISTSCFYPLPTEQAVRWLAEQEVPFIEIFFNSLLETDEPLLGEMKQILAASGTRVQSVHPYTSALEPLYFFSEYERRVDEALELYSRYFQAAAELGAEVFVLHGDRPGGFLSEEQTFERFARLAERGYSFGIMVTQENVVRNRGRDLGYLVRMKEYLGSLAAFTLDLKQALRSGYDPMEILDALGKSVRHIHISDSDGQSDCLPVGKGKADIAGFLAKLKALGYDDGVILELYRENYGGYEELTQSLSVLRGLKY
ncbi:MAG: sugar phosphate isomerase/epimerase [Oscillospiraceae bacterium]|nr:sugar phosphate isomerase/epimerase [Oscillospiraceae bacterium]